MPIKVCLACKANNPPFEEYCISCGQSLSIVPVTEGVVSVNDGLMESSENVGIFDLSFRGWLTPRIVKFLYFLQVVVFPIIGLLVLVIMFSKTTSLHLDMCEVMF